MSNLLQSALEFFRVLHPDSETYVRHSYKDFIKHLRMIHVSASVFEELSEIFSLLVWSRKEQILLSSSKALAKT